MALLDPLDCRRTTRTAAGPEFQLQAERERRRISTIARYGQGWRFGGDDPVLEWHAPRAGVSWTCRGGIMANGNSKHLIIPSTSKSEDLLRRARAGEDHALERLFARYLPRLRRWAQRRVPSWARGAADTDDLVQDVLVGTLKRIDYFEPQRDGALIGYLRRSLINRVRDQFREAARRPGTVPLDCEHPDTGDSPLTVAAEHEDRMRYQRALNRLKAADRRAIIARLDLGYSYEQVALVLKKPTPEAARQSIRRALSRLAEEMRNE